MHTTLFLLTQTSVLTATLRLHAVIELLYLHSVGL